MDPAIDLFLDIGAKLVPGYTRILCAAGSSPKPFNNKMEEDAVPELIAFVCLLARRTAIEGDQARRHVHLLNAGFAGHVQERARARPWWLIPASVAQDRLKARRTDCQLLVNPLD